MSDYTVLPPSFPGSDFVSNLAARQEESYRKQPIDLIGHYNHERSVADAYRGRQILELLQNADDAGQEYARERRILFRLTESHLIAANTGEPFTRKGIRSLVVSDVSPKQLSHLRLIGNKGLGFRAVLTWSAAPLVLSGPFLVAFSPEHAHARALALARELPELGEEFELRRREEKPLPVPTMRFPYVPDLANERARLALRVQDEGYDTVVVLPLPGGMWGESIRTDIRAQLEALTGETLLFCRYVERVDADSDEHRTWHLHRQGVVDNQTVVIEHADEARAWKVRRENGTLPPELIDEQFRETPEFEIAVAVPETALVPKDHKLCVFFPTDDGLPMRLLAHATLFTDDSRKRLIRHDANRFILACLAEFIATVVEEEAAIEADRALRLLAGAEACDPELEALGFLERLLVACRGRRIFPRLDGSLGTADEVRFAPSTLWPQIAPPAYFPELLRIGPDHEAKEFLSALKLGWYDDTALAARLEPWVAELPTLEAGLLVGRLLAARTLPEDVRPAILRSATGVLPPEHTAYLPGEPGNVLLPAWVRNFGFLDAQFTEGLRTALGVGSVRDTSSRLREAGYLVDEFQVEAVARHLVNEATAHSEFGEADPRVFCRDILQCIYQLAAAQGDTEGEIRPPLNVLTMRGSVRRASECYLGPSYPGAELVHAFYAPLDADEFVAAPEVLGISAEPAAVERFLVRLGVARRPREIAVKSGKNVPGLSAFDDYVLSRLEYPTSVFGHSYDSPEAAKRGLHAITFYELKVPDRFTEALERAAPEAIVAYLLGDGHAHLTAGDRSGAIFAACQGREQTPRRYHAVNVPDAAYYLLRTVPWVPCDDGTRKTPDRVILSRTGRGVLSTTFSSHTLDGQHASLRGVGMPSAIESVLRQLGAVYSLDSLRADDLYTLLLALPDRDPEGREAARIYRALSLESSGLDTNSPLREAFVRRGRMWGRRHGESAYYPVAELRYAPRFSLPAPIRDRVALVEIDPRRSSREVERIFGVRALSGDDFRIEVEEDETEYQPWSALANEHVRQGVPYLFAYRLSRTTDEAGREAAVLRSVQLHVCRGVGTRVTVLGAEPESVKLEEDLNGLVVRRERQLLLVCHAEEMPVDPVFWRAVGDLLAEAIEVAGAGPEFAQLLGCPGTPVMRRLLDLMTDGAADKGGVGQVVENI